LPSQSTRVRKELEGRVPRLFSEWRPERQRLCQQQKGKSGFHCGWAAGAWDFGEIGDDCKNWEKEFDMNSPPRDVFSLDRAARARYKDAIPEAKETPHAIAP
jgi:hypothetical protein